MKEDLGASVGYFIDLQGSQVPVAYIDVCMTCNSVTYVFWCFMLSSKIENAHWAEKTTTTCCDIRETATMQNFVLWVFLNKHDAGYVRLGLLGSVRLGYVSIS
jgi:hypothetical protein